MGFRDSALEKVVGNERFLINQTSSKLLANNSRKDALIAVNKSKAAHIASSLSVIDILSVLYSQSPESHIVVSKGHAAAGTYAVMVNAGLIPRDYFDHYCEDGYPLGGHVTSHNIPNVELSTGSLGHGLPYSVGIALAHKFKKSSRHCFVVMSDGECDEGTTWESALLASHHKLNNLTVAIDRNRLQSLDSTEATLALEPFRDKWEAFGWEAYEIDGHDHQQLAEAFNANRSNSSKPRVVICNTTKGKGVSFMENKVVWHYKPPSNDELEQALAELENLDA